MKFHSQTPAFRSRTRLAEAHKAKAEAESEMEVARGVLARLETATRAPAPINAELTMLDKDELAAMSAWAANPNAGAAPTPDADRRSELLKRLAGAEAQARSAAGAMAGPRAAIAAAGARASAAQRAAWIAAKLVAIDEAEANS